MEAKYDKLLREDGWESIGPLAIAGQSFLSCLRNKETRRIKIFDITGDKEMFDFSFEEIFLV